jgi:hypothetical protein
VYLSGPWVPGRGPERHGPVAHGPGTSTPVPAWPGATKGITHVFTRYRALTRRRWVAVVAPVAAAKTPPLTVFTIWPSHHPAALPKPGATISTREFGFIGASKIYVGQTVQWGTPASSCI